MSPLKAISSYYTIPLTSDIGPIRKHVSTFILEPREQMRETGEANRFC